MKVTHYLNEKFVSEEELLISPRDLGLTRGYAVFDFFRTYNRHKPFMFDYHINRLFNSAESIGLVLPWTKDNVKRIITKTLAKNDKSKEFALRVIITGGVVDPTLIVILDEAINFSNSIYENGIKAITINNKRIRPESKTTFYLDAIQNTHKMRAEGAEEILYVHDNYVLEGAYSNFFCIINNKLVTAKDQVLPGITRLIVLEKIKLKIPTETRDIKLNELNSATEAFLSVSGKGIVPVVKIDDNKVGNGKVGPITKDIIKKFDDFIASGKW